MPYPNFHAARQRDPSRYQRIRSGKPKGWPDGVTAIYGVRSDGNAELQSVRFDASAWTAARARAWLKAHNFSLAGFEAATGKAAPGSETTPMGERMEIRLKIIKVEGWERKIFGWLYVSRGIDGKQVVDHSGEIVSIKTLERASYNYVLRHRKMGDVHRKDAQGQVIQAGHLIECICYTPEKKVSMAKSLGLPDNAFVGVLPDAMWVGYQITDAETWADVLSGKKPDLSFGGNARRRQLAA